MLIVTKIIIAVNRNHRYLMHVFLNLNVVSTITN